MFSNESHNMSSESTVESCYMTYVVRKPSTIYIINSVAGCIANAILAVLGTFLNALVVCVFWKTPRLRKKVSYFMIMVLSSIDVCVSIIVHPFHLVNSITEITENSKCFYKMFYQTSAVMISGISFVTFFLMNIERYISIVHPFFHLNHVTIRKCMVLSSCAWVICITTGIAPVFDIDIQGLVMAISLIVIFGTFFIYVSIFYVARKRRRFQPNTGSGGAHEDLVSEEAAKSPENLHTLSKTVSFVHDLHLAKMYLLVVFCSIVLNVPNAAVLAVYTERVKTLDWVVHVKIWTLTLVTMNSTVNSLIFFWANKRLRREGWRICKQFLKVWFFWYDILCSKRPTSIAYNRNWYCCILLSRDLHVAPMAQRLVKYNLSMLYMPSHTWRQSSYLYRSQYLNVLNTLLHCIRRFCFN